MSLAELTEMNIVKSPYTQERSHGVNIFCEGTVRYSFVSHLAAALRREGIFVFVDACSNDQILAVTDGINVLVFPNMTETRKSINLTVNKVSKIIKSSRNKCTSPTFYCVDPLTQVHGWKSIVLLYTNLKNCLMYNNKLRDSELVDNVVRDINEIFYPPEPVGIYSRLLEIQDMLYKQPWGICRSIGIWGMPGIGKTTLAKAVFNYISNDYDVSCFIESFDEAFRKEGLHRLLDEKIGKILKEKFDICSSYIMRPSLLKEKLCDTSILVVLDDVRDPLFAESFLQRLDCFGLGRLVIMTSRDKTVFPFCQINHIYEVQGLNEHEALQLFCHSAFGRSQQVQKEMAEFSELDQKEMELSMKVIDYANGNSLALRIYGKELKKNMSEMEAAFLELKKYPPKEIQDVLKSEYSALGDNEKNIYWDIACVFRGENVDNVVQMLEGCRHFPRLGIDVLVEKCLVTISKDTLHMNNLILSLLSKDTESCTRMCEPSSIRYLLEDDETEATGEPKARPNCVLVNEDIEIISVDTSNLTFDVRHDAFKNMTNLKFLKIYRSCSEFTHGLNFPKGLDFLPCELWLLSWENYPLQSLPQDYDFGHLVELNMPYSKLHKIEAKTKLKMLKRILLCHSEQLVECDIPLYAQNIELIDLQGCTSLQSFPDTSQLQHLRVVNLSGCIKIKSFQGAPNIEELHLQGTSIKEIPTSIMSHSLQKVKLHRQKLLNLLGNFQDVEYIDLESVTELVKVSSHNQGFGKLVYLNMKDCSHLRSLPDMVNLESLQVLHLSGCSKLEEIKGFPKNMIKLYIGGTALQEVPQFPKSLEFLNAHGCTYLKSVCLDFEQLPVHYTFSNCFNSSLQVIAELLEKGLTRIASLARSAQQQGFIKAPEVSICIPAGTRQRSSFLLEEGPNVMANLDPVTRKPLSCFLMSIVVSFQDDCHNTAGLGIKCTCTWKDSFDSSDKKIERIYQCWAPGEAPKVEWDHMFIFYDTQMHPSGSEPKVKFEFHTVSQKNELLGANCRVTQCGVQIITAPTNANDTIPSEITREREATSISNDTDEEHHSPTSSIVVVEANTPNPFSSSEPRKVSSKLRSKGTMVWKWLKRIRRDKKKESLPDREQVDLTQPSTPMIRTGLTMIRRPQ